MIVLIAGNSPAEPMAWVRLQSAGGDIAGSGIVGVNEPIRGAAGDCILVIPGFDAQLRRLTVPTRSLPQARAAAAHVFKESLATDVGEAVFAVGTAADDTTCLAAAMSRARLAAWNERCAAMRLKPQAIYLDFSLLPVRDGVVDVLRLGERTLVSAGELGGFTIESGLAPAILGQWLSQLGPGLAGVRLQGWTHAELAQQLGSLPVETIDSDEETATFTLARFAMRPPSIAPNLAATSMDRARASASPLTPWLLAAALAVTAGLLQIGITVWDGIRDAGSAETILAAAEREFREARPEIKRVNNLRAQTTAALNALKAPPANPVIAASPLISEVLELHPDVQLDEVRLDAPGRTIELRLSSLLQPQLDSAVEGLREVAGQIEIGPMQAIDGRSSIAVSMGGA